MTRTSATIISTWTSNERGSVAPIFGLGLIPALMIMGGAVDVGRANNARSALQAAADAAAVAAASASNITDAERVDLGKSFFTSNFNAAKHGTPDVEVINSNGTVRIVSRLGVDTTLLKLAHVDRIPVTAAAGAAVSGGGGYACMLALSAHGSDAIHVQGSNNMSVEGCWAWANSDSAEAITGNGGAVATAAGFCAVGSYVDAGNYSPRPQTYCQPLADPYKSLATSAPSECDYTNKKLSNGNFTLSPGRYCGGIDVKPQANVTFRPGVYWIKGGSLTFQAGSTAYGEDVVFIFTGSNATLQLLGGANATFKGRTSGTYGGFLFIQDRASSVGATSTMQGGGAIDINGLVYMPTQTIQVGGNGDFNANAKMFGLIADRFDLQGNGLLKLKGDFEAAGLPNVLPEIPGSTHIVN